MYHHIRTINVTDDQMLTAVSCPPSLFLTHLSYLASENYHTVTFVDVQNYLFGLSHLPNKPIILTFDDGYSDNLWASQQLHKHNMQGVFFVVTKTLNTPEHLTTANLKYMYSLGMEIGSHGKYHVDLRKIRFDKVGQQIAESKKKLEEILGVPVISFCYPNGGYNRHISKACRDAGYWFARGTNLGISSIHGKHYALKTLRIDSKTTIPELKKLLQK